MTRYSYYTGMRPPAPFVLLTLRNPQTGSEARDVAAQIDTAADRLDQIGRIEIGGVGGFSGFMPLHDVLLGIASFPLRRYMVVAHADEPWVLLGRDVLNGHRVLLDGPNLVLELA